MGAGIKEQFSDVFMYDVFGIITGTYSCAQFPDMPCGMARFKARSANAGSFFIGHECNGVILLPYEIDASEDTGWFATSNLNRYFHNGSSGSSDLLAYWIQK